MARLPRSTFPAYGVWHATTRGVERREVFLDRDDGRAFLALLWRAVGRLELDVYGLCLMPNHYHLVVETGDGALSNAMKALNGRYAIRFNRRQGRDAHLFKNRFGAVLQESESQLLWTLRYIVRNPVESLCAHPGEWPWSSHRACAGVASQPGFLDVFGALSYFGDESEAARARYCRHVA